MRRDAFGHHQFGEGDYEQSEKIIQRLLGGSRRHRHRRWRLCRSIPAALKRPADWDNLQSSENYVGDQRTEHFASPGGAEQDQARVYTRSCRDWRSTSGLLPASGRWAARRLS